MLVKRILIMAIMLLTVVIRVDAQVNGTREPGFLRYDLVSGDSIRTLADDPVDFIDPDKSILKLQRQVDLQFLPSNFFPTVETETEPFKRRALRYGIAYYRDCEVPGLQGFFDVILPIRMDTRDGALKIQYYRTSIIVNTNRFQFPEDRPASAILPADDGSAAMMLFVIQDGKQVLVTMEGLFTENPHQVNFLITNDVEGIKSDDNAKKFAIFLRAGTERANLIILNTDVSLKAIERFDVIKDLPASNRAYVFLILPSLTFRGAGIK